MAIKRIRLYNHPLVEDIDIGSNELLQSLEISNEHFGLLEVIADFMYRCIKNTSNIQIVSSAPILVLQFEDAKGLTLERRYQGSCYTQSLICSFLVTFSNHVPDRLFAMIVYTIFRMHYRKYIIPVYEGHESRRDDYCASSFIVCINRKHYLITAKHVFYDLEKDAPVLYEDSFLYFGCKPSVVDISKAIMSPKIGDDYIIIPIDDKEVSEIVGNNFTPIPVSKIDLSGVLRKSMFLCHGFPETRNRNPKELREDDALIGVLADTDIENCIWIRFNKKRVVTPNWTIGESVNTPGMSGGPVWQLFIGNEVNWILKGLFTGYYKNKK